MRGHRTKGATQENPSNPLNDRKSQGQVRETTIATLCAYTFARVCLRLSVFVYPPNIKSIRVNSKTYVLGIVISNSY